MDYETIKRIEVLVREIDETKENIKDLPSVKRAIEECLLCPENLRSALPLDYLGYVLSNHHDKLRLKINNAAQQAIDLYITELEAKVEQKKEELKLINKTSF